MTDWGGANSKFLGLLYVGTAQSNGIETVCHQKNLSNDVKYITHMQSVQAKMEMYTKMKKKRRPCKHNMVYSKMN